MFANIPGRKHITNNMSYLIESYNCQAQKLAVL